MSVVVVLSPAALSSAAAAFLFFDFFLVLEDESWEDEASVLAVLSPAVVMSSAAAFSFFVFFLVFFVVVSVLAVSLVVDCALTAKGATAAANMKQKKTIHRVSLFLE